MTDHREDVAMEQVVQQPTDEVERLRKENEDLRIIKIRNLRPWTSGRRSS